jgi:RNA polymerase sigma-70 factor (ECF subfamily)
MDNAADDDASLMLAYAGGRVAAFDTLYARHRERLYRFILRSAGNRATADEIFQETWSRAIAARARYRPEARFTTWLLQIAHNLLVDSFRRARPYTGPEETEAVMARQAIDEADQPEHTLSQFEQRRRLQRAIEQLPDDQRTCFLLRMEHELTLDDMAQVTGVGRETVKSRLRYAMSRIRELMAE